LLPKYKGPFRITKVINRNNFEISEDNSKRTWKVNCDQLRPVGEFPDFVKIKRDFTTDYFQPENYGDADLPSLRYNFKNRSGF
jgi:hypothetical protein